MYVSLNAKHYSRSNYALPASWQSASVLNGMATKDCIYADLDGRLQLLRRVLIHACYYTCALGDTYYATPEYPGANASQHSGGSGSSSGGLPQGQGDTSSMNDPRGRAEDPNAGMGALSSGGMRH